MAYPKTYRYTKEHEWVNVEGGLATIGITDYAQHEILGAIGARSVDELFSGTPERFRLREGLKIPGPCSEAEVIQYFKERAAENSIGYTSFLGAGVYNPLRSVVTDAIIQRGEFLTSYTPYQAEIAQGTLQAIFEFQTLMSQLTCPEVAHT